MSKERLEEIKERMENGYEFNPSSIEIQQLDLDMSWLFKYAKEQAERVQELRMFKTHTESLAEVVAELEEQNKRYREALEPIPAEEWHDDDGHVVWWRLPVEEPPYVGSPLCDDFTFGYYTHYTKILCPLEGDPHESK